MEATKEYLIEIQKSQLAERAHYVQESVLAELTSVLEKHNKRVVNPHNILRGVDLDTMLANYAIQKANGTDWSFEEYHGLSKI